MTTTFFHPFSISVFALCIAGLVFIAVLVPLFWPRKHRFAYRTALSAFLLLCTILLWCRDHNGRDEGGAVLNHGTTAGSSSLSIGPTSQAGTMLVLVTYFSDASPKPHGMPGSAQVFWRRSVWSSGAKLGPLTLSEGTAWSSPGAFRFSRWGFEALLSEVPPLTPAPSEHEYMAGMVIPHWFVAMILAAPVAHSLYFHLWGRARWRRRHGLCTKCGYSLQGLPDPVRCPECGRPAHENAVG
jgi:hypothetical protein